MAEGEINIDNIIQRLLEGENGLFCPKKRHYRVPRYLLPKDGVKIL